MMSLSTPDSVIVDQEITKGKIQHKYTNARTMDNVEKNKDENSLC